MKMVCKVGERGVLTIPKEARDAIGISQGDIVEFQICAVYPLTPGRKGARRPILTEDPQ